MMRSGKQIQIMVLSVLSVFGVLAAYCASGDIEEGLVAYFKFETEDGNMLLDSSGLEHDADVNGDVEWVEGKYGKGLQFDGKSSYADISPGVLGPFEAVTITVWIKLEQMPTTNSYNIAGMTTGAGSGFYIELYNVTLAAWQCQPNNTNASVAYPTTFSEWHHVAAVYTGDQILLYIDGEQKATGVGAALPSVVSLPFRISGPHSELAAWGGSIDGVIDELRLYDRALEADEIKDAMEESGSAVTPAGKLPTRWARVKIK